MARRYAERERQGMRYAILFVFLLFFASLSSAQTRPVVDQVLPPSYIPSGQTMFQQYCASCHGADGKGGGPMASRLKTPPSDLTTLVKRRATVPPYDRKFPTEYVKNILEFGPGSTAHGSSDMPAWGPIFRYFDNQNERAVQQRIKNLCDYLASVQER
jgi:mono/diheme cytochrome c family protein